MMGDFGKGIKSFKQGMNEEADRPVTPPLRRSSRPRRPPTVAPQPPVQQPVHQPTDQQGPRPERPHNAGLIDV
jgi:sec-independent protein translocase protein TatA